MKLGVPEWIALILVIVGGLNWGIIGFFDYSLIDAIFGIGSGISRVIYGLVGVASVWLIVLVSQMKK